MTNINYLTHFLKHNLFPSDKLDLDAEEEAFVNKMLFDLGENILAFLNSTQQTQNRTLAENQTTNGFLIENEHLRSMVGSLSIVNIKRFNPQMVVNFVNTRANQFLPLLKSFSSIFYTLIFVILDGSSVLLNYVLNFVSFHNINRCFNLMYFRLSSSWHCFIFYRPVGEIINQLSSWTHWRTLWWLIRNKIN